MYAVIFKSISEKSIGMQRTGINQNFRATQIIDYCLRLTGDKTFTFTYLFGSSIMKFAGIKSVWFTIRMKRHLKFITGTRKGYCCWCLCFVQVIISITIGNSPSEFYYTPLFIIQSLKFPINNIGQAITVSLENSSKNTGKK